ncbi:MAG TPA: pyridoxamine 5'-phosphate oxidase family protein, partial [Spirochaetia bacterium]|jgi:nitroimidazol reductase NimA-like FMN-containing flavoprotein (pyridoxamine 5'-phosphate oxidase superfamily)|nr:pyridoxamine 5'-phosphate oxidase family protein [Spirochaetia bacterium]
MESYHPRRKRNEIISDAEKAALLEKGDHITIALCDNNIPYVVTLSYGLDKENNCLYFHCANKGDKLDFISKNPNVCATVIHDNGYMKTKCDHDYETLVIRGELYIVNELSEKKHGLQILLNHLEKDPKPIFERNIKDDHSYDGVTILRMNMKSIIGKKHIG